MREEGLAGNLRVLSCLYEDYYLFYVNSIHRLGWF
jgi:hypothetical protein